MANSKTFVIIFVAFFIGIMIFSSLVVFFNDDNKPSNPSNPAPTPGSTSVPALKFQSVEFSAKVTEVFPQLVIAGQTKEYNIGNIESEIAKIKGFKSFSSSGYAGNNPLVYRAEILLLPGTVPSEFFSRLSQNTKLLTGLESAGVGLVELPSSIEVSNSDLNISKKFTPPQHLTQAFLSLSTIKGDSINASLNVSLANDVPSNIQVFEASNPNSQASQFLEKTNSKVVSLEKRLLVQGEMNFGNFIDENSLKPSLNFSGFVPESITVMPLQKSLAVSISQQGIDENELNRIIQNSSLQELKNAKLSPSANGFELNVAFNEGADLNVLESGIESVLSDANVSKPSISFTRPLTYFLLDLNLSTTDSKPSFDFLNSFFNPKGISFTALQPLTVDLNSLFIKDLNASLALPSSLVVMSKPGHSIGESVDFNVQVQVLRGKITQAQGSE